MLLEKIALFAILLGVLVLIHELGHFLVAKAFRVQVLKFSFGFGPELLGFWWGETRYAISAFPLGGFVRMAGEDDLVERFGGPDTPVVDEARVLGARPRWQRALIFAAGPLANVLLPFVIFSIDAYGEGQVIPAVVETVFPGTPAAEAGLQAGDRILAIDGEPVDTFSDISERVSPRAGETVQVDLRRGDERLRIAIPLRRATDQDALQRKVERGRMGIASFRRRPLLAVLPGSAAAEAGLKSLDVVIQVDGESVARFEEVEAALRRAAGREVSLRVERRRIVCDGALRLELPEYREVTLPAAAAVAHPVEIAEEVIEHSALERRVDTTGRVARFTISRSDVPPLGDDVEAARRLAEVGVRVLDISDEDVRKTQAEARSRLEALADPSLRGIAFGGACLADVVGGTPAAQLGLKRGDCVAVLDGVAVGHWGDIQEAFTARPGAVHLAVVARGGQMQTVAFPLEKREEKARLRRGQERRIFGALPPIAFAPGTMEKVHLGALGAVAAGAERTVTTAGLVLAGLGLLATAQLPFESLGGPMMMFDLAGQATERGLGYFLSLMALISINLAILNLLPIPVLDGGHLLFLAVEAVTRRSLPKRAKEIAILIGFGLLLLLMAAVFRNDIARYWNDITGLFK